MQNYPLTCVSGYWKCKNKHSNKYEDEWFQNTLKLQCPYVFFGDKKGIEIIKLFRGNFITHYIEMEISDFYSSRYKDLMITDDWHCPSVELNLIWNEKIFLIERATLLNPFKSEFFAWADAGLCTYREYKPAPIMFPNKNRLNILPCDKFIYSASEEYEEHRVDEPNWHHISGSAYIIHKNFVAPFTFIYKTYMDRLINKERIWTDQVIWTHIYRDHKNLFHKIGWDYGQLFLHLH